MRLLERLAIVLVSFAVAIGVIVALSGGPLGGSDHPGVSTTTGQIGQQFADLGDAHLSPGAPRPHYNSEPPTSGPHVPAAVRHDGGQLSDDQLLQALSLGNVVVLYGTRAPPPVLRSLPAANGGRFSPTLAAAGQAVILSRRPGTRGLLALAWTRMLHVTDAANPELHRFILLWLGQGAKPSHN